MAEFALGVDGRGEFIRQIRVFGEAGQKTLHRLTVGIVGLGGIGSFVFFLLVRLGVGHIVIIDHDIVEESNLNRLAGSTPQDVRKKAHKVHMLKQCAARVNPGIKVIAVPRSLLTKGVLRCLKPCDAIFGCTDNPGTRWLLNNFAIEHLMPYFDTGTGIQADANQNIDHAGGQLRVVIPGMGCLNCINGIDVSVAQQELMPEPDRQVAIQRGYIAGADVRAPAVASLNGVIANLAVTEFMAFVTGFRSVHRYVFYDFLNAQVVTLPFEKDPSCFTCSKAGSFATGDDGKPLPADMLLYETKANERVKGDRKMELKTPTVREGIEMLLAKAKDKELKIKGSPEGRWFLLKNVKTGRPFNRPQSDIMVKFLEGSNDPIILVPENLAIDTTNGVCPNFVEKTTYIEGWKALCPYIFSEIGDEVFEFILYLSGLLTKPSLCGLMGCEGRNHADNKK